MKSNILKVIIIDNDLALHDAYRFYFEKYWDYSLVGIYSSIKSAFLDYENVMPDIIVSEVSMPEINGIEGIKFFHKKKHGINVIMISGQSDFDSIKKAFKNGANGYLTKPVSKKCLLHALNSIKHEGAAMSNDIVKKVISSFYRKSYQFFSERENQIIDYLCRGATYKIIADRLFVTTSTINFHIQNIYLKLNVNSKSEALIKLKEL